tara:strand:- start:2927 stop:3583 length:657 start_codon:yes stop_codon:yes gene_type:complete
MKVILSDSIIELSEEQLELYVALKTKLKKKFALNTLEGMNGTQAYLDAGGKAKTETAQTSGASEILTHPDVERFIRSFDQIIISKSIMGREEMLQRLTAMARTSITDVVDIHHNVTLDVDEDGKEIKQSVWALKDQADLPKDATATISELTASKDGMKIKLHDQKAAMKQIADIEGFNAAIRLAHGGDPDAPPIQVEKIPDDPIQAAKAYQDMLSGKS